MNYELPARQFDPVIKLSATLLIWPTALKVDILGLTSGTFGFNLKI